MFGDIINVCDVEFILALDLSNTICSQMARVVVLVDMDCFYAQVEQRDRPELWGKPVGVLQYSANGQSGLIAVSYEARPFGVKRGMTAKQSKELCSDIEICLVPQGEHADKADIQKYRDASAEVFAVLGSTDSRVVLERASVDEAFLDVTAYVESRLHEESREDIVERLVQDECLPTSYVVDGEEEEEAMDGVEMSEDEKRTKTEGWRRQRIRTFIESCVYDDECLKIALAAEYAERLREQVREKTQFYCSAGIANNKMMAKLVCAVHKPRKQSFVPPKGGAAEGVLKKTKIGSIRGLGGKLGWSLVQTLGVTYMGDLLALPPGVLSSSFPAHAEWLTRLARGEDDEPVKARSTQTSIGVGKNFPGKLAINSVREARHWLDGLVKELAKRLADDRIKNRRVPQNIVVHITTDTSISRTCRMGGVEMREERIMDKLWPVMMSLRKGNGENTWHPPIVNISLSAGKFLDGIPSKEASITGWMEKRMKQLVAENAQIDNVDPGAKEAEEQEAATWSDIDKEDDENDVGDDDDDDVIIIDDDQPGPSNSTGSRHGKDKAEFQLDDEGWQIWPTNTVTESSATNKQVRKKKVTKTKKNVKDDKNKEISRDILYELPANIRQEIMHQENLKAAKELKQKQAEKEAAKGGTVSRKRKGAKDEDAKKVKKPISDFFGAKSK